MPEVKLIAELRTEFGKGAARRIRRADKVPAVLYGHGTAPIHITLPGHETLLALRTANALLSINVDGKAQLALPKQVQRDPIKHTIEHVDLVIVRRGEKVTVDVPVHIEGEAASETLVVVEHSTRDDRGRGDTHPAVDRGFGPGPAAGNPDPGRDLSLPEGSTLALDPEILIVNVTAAQSAEAAAAELAEAEAEAGIEPTMVDETGGEEPGPARSLRPRRLRAPSPPDRGALAGRRARQSRSVVCGAPAQHRVRRCRRAGPPDGDSFRRAARAAG